ncbi:MAG: hypothetical protein D6696_01735 [Acidobacteria bacterium]|nr:MAG: hypothetical protein D6696_01735 [Acidobacteriota bacterium]
MAGLAFREIEHKFVVGDGFDLAAFRRRVTALGPRRTATLDTRDVYYRIAGRPHHVFRHRYDPQLQHLSVKSVGGDGEERLEVNLDLGAHRGDQSAAVEAFMATLGVAWRGVIHKRTELFEFADCEVVFYRAQGAGRRVCCVEVEAIGAGSLDQARAVLERYEQALDLAGRRRSRRPLVALLYPEFDAAPAAAE